MLVSALVAFAAAIQVRPEVVSLLSRLRSPDFQTLQESARLPLTIWVVYFGIFLSLLILSHHKVKLLTSHAWNSNVMTADCIQYNVCHLHLCHSLTHEVNMYIIWWTNTFHCVIRLTFTVVPRVPQNQLSTLFLFHSNHCHSKLPVLWVDWNVCLMSIFGH